MNDLPTRGPHDPPIHGPHVTVHDDGTRQMVMGGPNTWRPQSVLARTLWEFTGFVAGIIIVIPAMLLGLEYGALSLSSRLAVAAISAAGVALLAAKHAIARRAVRS